MLSTEQLDILEELFPSKEEIYSLWEKHLNSEARLTFFYKALIRSLDEYKLQNHSAFDAHTTSNCCHGMAVLANLLVYSLRSVQIDSVKADAIKRLNFPHQLDSIRSIDWRVLLLTAMHVLMYCFDRTTRKTSPKNLRALAPIAINFAEELVPKLQNFFSNKVAKSYKTYFKKLNPQYLINDVLAELWGQYVQPPYFRMSAKGVTYVSCLFSTQIALAYLIHSRKKFALMVDSSQNLDIPYIKIFQGLGNGKYELISQEDLTLLEPSDLPEPLVVFRGQSDSTLEDLNLKMTPWLNNLSGLILACDTHTPQFPKVSIDPNFDSSPIISIPPSLTKTIQKHKEIPGVSRSDYSLFCLTHIFPASLYQMIAVMNGAHHMLPTPLNSFSQNPVVTTMK